MLLCAASCKKEKIAEIDKLPSATQTGANTFGCLVNGKAWVAQRNDCNIFCDASFKVFYDASLGGSLSLISVFINSENNNNEKIIISFDSTNFKMMHIYQNKVDMKFAFTDYTTSTSCADLHSVDSFTNATGKVQLTRYDLANGVVSGIFSFTLSQVGCETITVTDGRFDKKL